MISQIPDTARGQTPAAPADPPDPAPRPRHHRRRPSLALDRFSGLYVLLLLVVAFSIWMPDTFATTRTLRSVADEQAITAIVSLALVVPLAAGVFDLSVAALLGFSVCVVAWLQSHGCPAALSVLVALATGAFIGAVNGFVVIRLKVNSFIATLGMSSILAAAAYYITDGQPIVSGISETYQSFARNDLFGVPLPVCYLITIALVLWLLLEYTPLGRLFYATGGNPQAARLAGVRVDRMTFYSLVMSGFLAALAAVILTAKLGTGSAEVGPPYLLPAFSAAFLGATQIKAGRVNVFGTLVAVYLLAVGVKGLQLRGAPVYVDDLFNGTALIIAVALAARSTRRA